MKQPLPFSPLQRAFTLVMAALTLFLVVYAPAAGDKIPGIEKATYGHSTVDNASFHEMPDFPPCQESLTRINILFFGLPKLWAMLLSVSAPEIREYQAVFLRFFIPRINFVFVSSQAP